MNNPAEDTERETLLEFPSRFPIKAMGRYDDAFEAEVREIVFRHAKIWQEEEVRLQPSRAGNFLSITIVIEALSQSQLDAIYQELSDSEQVIMAL